MKQSSPLKIRASIVHLKASLAFLPEEEKEKIIHIINDLSKKITDHNNNEMEVINPTKTETGKVFSSIKKNLKAKFKLDGLSEVAELYGLIERTRFPKELIDAKILHSRNVSNWCNPTPHEREVSIFILTELEKVFYEQNKKYYEQKFNH